MHTNLHKKEETKQRRQIQTQAGVAAQSICWDFVRCNDLTSPLITSQRATSVLPQQELPGGGEPAGEDRRLWHVQGRLQHWLLQGRCMCPTLYFLLLFLLFLIPAAWILPSSSPYLHGTTTTNTSETRSLLGPDHSAQLKPVKNFSAFLHWGKLRLFGGYFFCSVKQPVNLPRRPYLINGTSWLIGVVHFSCPLRHPQWQSDNSDSADREFKWWQRQDGMREWTLNFG